MSKAQETSLSIEKMTFRIAVIALLCLGLTTYLGKAWETSLQAMDSSVHARLALEATATGIVPILPIGAQDPSSASWVGGFNDHPFVPFYLNGWVMRFFGPSAWSARFLPALFGVGCLALTVAIALSIATPAYALMAGLILATTPEFILYTARFHLDAPLAFLILASFLMWIRRKGIWGGAFAGLGVWAKTPVGLLIIPSALILNLIRRDRSRWQSWVIACLSALTVTLLLWLLTAWIGGWAVVQDYWRRQVWGTAIGGRGFGGGPDYLSFFKILKARYWPWMPFFLFGTFKIVKNWKKSPEALQLCLIGISILVFVISSMKFRFFHYFIPAYPFAALISAWPLARFAEKRRLGLYQFTIILSLVLMAFLLNTPVPLAPEMFPALKRFNAIIQTHKDCRQSVLMITGNQPYGSESDYGAEVGFYTSRGIVRSTCEEAQKVNFESHPFVLVAGDHFNQCIPDIVKKQYSRIYKYGNQYLLTRFPKEDVIDLTPLERELNAVRDCAPETMKHDIYHAYE
jgi:hypothetical protein